MRALTTTDSWVNYFQDVGLSADVVEQHRGYLEGLLSKSLPIIFDCQHLCMLLGVSDSFAAAVLNASSSNYREFRIPKRSGGSRTIIAPRRALKSCQRWILENILSRINCHPAAKGFVRRRSTKSHCRPHVGRETILKLDFRDFFPSIEKRRVIALFRSFGYTDSVSLYLASFCCFGERLPQGGVTSPAISNLICRRLDSRLTALATSKRWRYTRYADDIVISGRGLTHRVIDLVSKIGLDEGFELNSDKTRLYRGGARPVVTGLVIGSNELAVPREFKREVAKQVYYVLKFGVLSHSAKTKSRNPYLVSTLLGKLNYWLHVEPSNARAQGLRDGLLLIGDRGVG